MPRRRAKPGAAGAILRALVRPDAKLDGWFFRRAAVFEAVTGILALLAYLARNGDRETQRALAENLPSLIWWIVGIYLVGGTAHQVLMSKLPDAVPQPAPEKKDAA